MSGSQQNYAVWLDNGVSWSNCGLIHIFRFTHFQVLEIAFSCILFIAPSLPLLFFCLYHPWFFTFLLISCFSCFYFFLFVFYPFLFSFFPSLMAGFPQSTHPNCRSGVTAICGRWVRFPSIGVWTAWTQQGCWLRLNSAPETRATWEQWAPSARLVALWLPCLFFVSLYGPRTSTVTSDKAVQWEEIPSVAILRPKLAIRSPSGKLWKKYKKTPNLLISVYVCMLFSGAQMIPIFSDWLIKQEGMQTSLSSLFCHNTLFLHQHILRTKMTSLSCSTHLTCSNVIFMNNSKSDRFQIITGIWGDVTVIEHTEELARKQDTH